MPRKPSANDEALTDVMSAPIRVFVADDHAVVCQGIIVLLEQQPDMVPVGQAASSDELLRVVKPGAWDVLILDLALSGEDDVRLVTALKKAHERGRILVYSAHREGPMALQILRGGADGYLSKRRSLDELLTAIRTVHTEGRFVTGTIAELLLRVSSPLGASPACLSEREFAVLVRLARGERPSEIAASLGIQPSTVSTHIKGIRDKLGLSSNAELIQYAMKHGLVD